MPKLLFILFLITISVSAHGWSAKGHAEIAKAAFIQLTPAQQNAYARLLKGNRISHERFSPAAQIGYLARWPDHQRKLKLQQLFSKYGSGTVPPVLAARRQQDTRLWHFENALYIDGEGRVLNASKTAGKGVCPPARNGQLFQVWPSLLQAYRKAEDKNDKVLLLSLLLHMSGDAWQPLHVMAGLQPDCRHDAGGNGFCVQPGPARFTGYRERCHLSLHQAWDRGFDLFEQPFKPAAVKYKRKSTDLEGVLKHHRRWAGEIYPTAQRPFESAGYQSRAGDIIHSAASLAVAQQTQLLRDLAPR